MMDLSLRVSFGEVCIPNDDSIYLMLLALVFLTCWRLSQDLLMIHGYAIQTGLS